MNGEAPGPNATEWRKPGPKMLLQAAEELDINLKDVFMVGDNQSDIDAGINAGCKGSILVETARNKKITSPNATYTAPNLLDAVHYIVSNS
jgi:histidinol phosphatase-like enzyme